MMDGPFPLNLNSNLPPSRASRAIVGSAAASSGGISGHDACPLLCRIASSPGCRGRFKGRPPALDQLGPGMFSPTSACSASWSSMPSPGRSLEV
jgi:hypothetical protein